VWPDDPTSTAIVGYAVEGDAGAMAGALQREMRPAPVEDLVRALTKMDMLTKRRQGEEGDTKLLIAAYLERLSEIPADMALYALKEAPKRSPWFPSWHELYEIIEDELRDREMMLEAVA